MARGAFQKQGLPLAAGRLVLHRIFDLHSELSMYIRRYGLPGSLVVGVCFILGCSDEPKGMQNMKLNSGPDIQKDLPLKKGKKPMPPDPVGPKAPPR